MALVLLPYMYVADPTRGRPVFNGKIYIGGSDTDPRVIENQKEALLVQEDGSSVPAEYPILTNAGGIPTYNGSPVAIDVLGEYSVAIDDRNDQQVYYYPNAGSDVEFLATDLRSIMFDLGYTYSDIGIQLVTSTPDTGLDEAEYLLDIGSGLVWRLPTGIPQSSTVVSVSDSTLTTNNGQFEMIAKGNDITQVVPPLTTVNGYFRSGMVLASGVLLPTNDDFAASEDIVFNWKAGLSGCAGVTVDDDGILFSAADVDYSIVTSVELGAGTQITDANQLTLYLMDNNGAIHYIKNGENSVVIDVTAGVATFEIKSGVFADLGITSIKRAFGLFEVGVVGELSEQGVIDAMQAELLAARVLRDVTSSRASGVEFENKDKVSRILTVYAFASGTSDSVNLLVNGQVVGVIGTGGISSSDYGQLYYEVKSGDTYRINVAGNVSQLSFIEAGLTTDV